MIEKGISVYTGLGYSVNANMSYLKQVPKLGYTRIALIFGDPFASKQELTVLARLKTESIDFAISVEPETSIIEQCILFKNTNANQLDPGEFAVLRSTVARGLSPPPFPSLPSGAPLSASQSRAHAAL